MKVEIDLNDILGCDENGPGETLQESIRRQVIQKVTEDLKKGIKQKLDEQVSKIMNEQIGIVMTEKMPALISDIMDTPYTPVDRYGSKDKPTSFREQLIKVMQENMVYKPTPYHGDKNTFTRAVDDTITKMIDGWKKSFDTKVNDTFTASAFEYATSALKKKLGISA